MTIFISTPSATRTPLKEGNFYTLTDTIHDTRFTIHDKG